MFNKKCSKCKNKIKKDYDFCPFCGNNLRSKYDQEDFGFLGKNDLITDNLSMGNSFMDKIFNNAMKMLERQMKNLANELPNQKFQKTKIPNNLNVQFFVNGKRVFPEKQEVKMPIIKNKPNNIISKEKLNEISRLPKKEPLSKIRRLSGKIIYELSVPGVKNIEDVIINQLENSIEIKALSKNTVYAKTINLKLPLLKYRLINELLIIELQAR